MPQTVGGTTPLTSPTPRPNPTAKPVDIWNQAAWKNVSAATRQQLQGALFQLNKHNDLIKYYQGRYSTDAWPGTKKQPWPAGGGNIVFDAKGSRSNIEYMRNQYVNMQNDLRNQLNKYNVPNTLSPFTYTPVYPGNYSWDKAGIAAPKAMPPIANKANDPNRVTGSR